MMFKKLKVFFIAAVLIAFFAFTDYLGAEIYSSFGKRDPFVPLVGGGTARAKEGLEDILTVEDVSLQGILVGEAGVKSVIINGEVIGQGEQRGIFSIENISDNTVKVKIGEDVYDINLYE